jgi:hypothetical protein
VALPAAELFEGSNHEEANEAEELRKRLMELGDKEPVDERSVKRARLLRAYNLTCTTLIEANDTQELAGLVETFTDEAFDDKDVRKQQHEEYVDDFRYVFEAALSAYKG